MSHIDEVDMVHATPSDPAIAQQARVKVIRQATDLEDATRLLAMLGLLDEKPEPRGCRVCGGQLPVYALAPKAGMRGCCGAVCKRRLTDPEYDHDAAPAEAEEVVLTAAPDAGRALPPMWHYQAACAGADAELWFSLSEVEQVEARRTCLGCPVRHACGTWALDTGITHGIWGGYRLDAVKERRALRAKHDRSALQPEKAGVEHTCSCGEVFTASTGHRTCPPCRFGLVPVDEAAAAIAQMRAAGIGLRSIAILTGIAVSSIKRATRADTTKHIKADIAARLIACAAEVSG